MYQFVTSSVASGFFPSYKFFIQLTNLSHAVEIWKDRQFKKIELHPHSMSMTGYFTNYCIMLVEQLVTTCSLLFYLHLQLQLNAFICQKGGPLLVLMPYVIGHGLQICISKRNE